MSLVEITEHIAALQRDGDLLAAAAEKAGLAAAIPSCPSWQMRDLLRHLSYVHRWATGYVVEQRAERLPSRASETEVLAGDPPDDELLGYFRAGHGGLVEALSTADPGLQCWSFLPAPSPLAFWARRQAHETAIHRVDAELASGEVSPFPADFAADGVDELIMGFLGRDSEEVSDEQRAGPQLRVLARATDTGGEWLLELTSDGERATRVQRGGGEAMCTLAGPAASLYLTLWNRAVPAGGTTPRTPRHPADAGIEVSGDLAVYAAWQRGMRITWA
jgi:uncharacterized protein (TIGR03083 family)